MPTMANEDAGWQQKLLEKIQKSQRPLPQETVADPWTHQPEHEHVETWIEVIPQPSGRNGAWHRRDFIGIQAEVFTQQVYRMLLGREADPDGLRAYTAQCGTWLGRVAVVHALATSPEGRSRGLRVTGCALPAWLWRLSRGPLRTLLNACWLWFDAESLVQTLMRQQVQQHVQTAAKLREHIRAATARLADDSSAWKVLEPHAALVAHEAMLDGMRSELKRLRAEQEELRVRLTTHTERQDRTTVAARPDPIADLAEPAERELLEDFYLAFEDACRGNIMALWAKLEPYLAELPPAPARLVDLGCGRGEWIQLTQQVGYQALGVEPNGKMVERCREAGVPVVQADGLAWLRAQPSSTVDVLTAFQVAEHLPFGVLLAWLKEAARVLKPGGVMIVETPNPENILVGSHTFYHDPTHRNPLTPTLLQFAFDYCGLKVEKVLRLNPYPAQAKVPGEDPLTERVNGHLCGPQDFAVIGVRP